MKKILMYTKKELGSICVFCSLSFLLGLMLVTMIGKVFEAGEPDYQSAQIGAMMVLAVGLIVVIAGSFALQNRFNLSICMGYTRKSFILRELLEGVIATAFVFGISLVFYLLDNFFQSIMFPGVGMEIDLRVFIAFVFEKPLNLLAFIIIITSIRFFVGTVFMHFGMVAFWVMWALWMGACLIPARMSHADGKRAKQIVEMLGNAAKYCGGYFWQLLGVVVCVLLVCGACVLVLRQEVKDI